jgi:cell division protein FtsQ
MPALSADRLPRSGKQAAAPAPVRRRALSRSRRLIRRFALPGAALLVAGGLAWSASTGGIVAQGWAAVRGGTYDLTASLGFKVEEVLISGRRSVDSAVVLYALGVRRGDPILAFDPDAARVALEAIPWVEHATVERRLPDTIYVAVEERRPMALWQNGGDFRLVDPDGTELPVEAVAAFPEVPMIVGPDAPKAATELLPLLAARPTIGGHVASMVRVGGRRWDLHLDSGVIVRLPEMDVAAALDRLVALQESDRILDRDILALDLRIPDRIAIEASPLAAARTRSPQENT